MGALIPLHVEYEGSRWPLWQQDAQGEPLAKDIDVATWLGYVQPRDIRKLADRYTDEIGVFSRHRGAKFASDGTSPGRGRPNEVYLFTEAQALFLAAKSETPRANAVLKAMIHVFILARRGTTPATPVPPPLVVPSALAEADSAARRAELAAFRADLAQLPALRAEVAATRAEIVAVRSLASEALERMVSTEEMADLLGVPLPSFKSMIRRDDALAALGLPLDQQLGHRWRPSQVRAHLQQRAVKRGRPAKTAGKAVAHG